MYITSNNNNRNMSRNSFQRTNKPAVEEFSLKSALFPELPELPNNDSNDSNDNDSNDNDSNDNDSSVTIINYKSILLTPVPENFVQVVRIKEKTEYELKMEEKRAYHNEVCKVIDIMSKKWVDFRLKYIEMWSEDEYERWYIPLSEWDKAIIGEDDDDDDDYESSGDEENCDY